MPNHASNALIVQGPEAIAFFAAVADGKDENFVATLVPMPEELSGIQSGSVTIDGEQVSEWRVIDGRNVKITDIDRQHTIDLHGTTDWYEWCNKNWSTKWGAYDCDIDQEARAIRFNSAWSPPLAAIETISGMFPDTTFTIAYSEGGSAYFGKSVFENGVCVEAFESHEFWNEDADWDNEDADIYDRLTPECAAHLEEYGLGIGG